jgi:hypothetical protein
VRIGAPGAPGLVSVAKDTALGSIKVTWTAAAKNDATIESYVVKCVTATGATKSAVATSSPRIMTGLTRTSAYRCNVAATNKYGTGPAREAPAAILPK